MFKLIRSYYTKFIKNKYFNKIMLIYTLIIISSLSALLFVVLQNVTKILWNNSVTSNKQVLQSTYEYFNSKQAEVKESLQHIYEYPSISSNIFYILNNELNSENYDDISRINLLEDYLNTIMASDNDILDVALIKKSDNTIFHSSRYLYSVNSDNLINRLSQNGALGYDKYGVTILPTTLKKNNNSSEEKKYSYTYVIWNENLSKPIGKIIINLRTDSIKNSYSIYKDSLKGYILILTSDGNVIFDSSGRYYNKKYPYFNKLNPSVTQQYLEEDSIVDYYSPDDSSGLVYVAIVPKSQIYQSINSTKNTICLIFFVLLSITLVLIYISTSKFSKRVKILNDAMKKVQDGNFSLRIKTDSLDEIGQISNNFNNMCSKLEEYIKKVYTSELIQKELQLKQKTAELYALQSQMDPHFLYNSLEVIRMKAVTSGKDDVGKMIQILASLFRNSTNNQMIVKIKDELEYCESYLEFYSYRFEDKLETTFDIDNEILEYGIMKHTLQPLIENAIVHGIDFSNDNNNIKIKGKKVGGDIYISIIDNGKGMDEELLSSIRKNLESHNPKSKSSIGILNVNQRIKLVYGDGFGISITSKIGQGTTVVVKIAAKTKKELESNVQCADS